MNEGPRVGVAPRSGVAPSISGTDLAGDQRMLGRGLGIQIKSRYRPQGLAFMELRAVRSVSHSRTWGPWPVALLLLNQPSQDIAQAEQCNSLNIGPAGTSSSSGSPALHTGPASRNPGLLPI